MSKITILTETQRDVFGYYDVRFHTHKLTWEGKEYEYHSSGLCRHVFIDPDKKFVIKVPSKDLYDEYKYEVDLTNKIDWSNLPWSVCHNILEAKAYEQCPPDLKSYFAKTELIQFGWLKQEYVEVFRVNIRHDLRELGRRVDGSICLFDYDPIINYDDDYDVVYDRWIFERTIKLMTSADV